MKVILMAHQRYGRQNLAISLALDKGLLIFPTKTNILGKQRIPRKCKYTLKIDFIACYVHILGPKDPFSTKSNYLSYFIW